MIKTFTLNKVEEQQLSERTGTMTFYLTDEIGEKRQVTGSTFLDEHGKAKGISSSNKRELPLVQMLFEMEPDDTCELEFKYYNAIFDRDQNKTANQIAYEKVLEMEREKRWPYRLIRIFKRLVSRKVSKSGDSQSSAA